MDRSTDERPGRRQLPTRAGTVAVGGAVAGLTGGAAEAAPGGGLGPAGGDIA